MIMARLENWCVSRRASQMHARALECGTPQGVQTGRLMSTPMTKLLIDSLALQSEHNQAQSITSAVHKPYYVHQLKPSCTDSHICVCSSGHTLTLQSA